MAFERACSLTDLADGEAHAVTVDDQELAIALHRTEAEGEEVFAVEDLCSHASVALSEGEVADCTIECWLHGSTFDLRTGKPTAFPATEPVATFPVEVRDGEVYVDVSRSLNGVTPG